MTLTHRAPCVTQAKVTGLSSSIRDAQQQLPGSLSEEDACCIAGALWLSMAQELCCVHCFSRLEILM